MKSTKRSVVRSDGRRQRPFKSEPLVEGTLPRTRSANHRPFRVRQHVQFVRPHLDTFGNRIQRCLASLHATMCAANVGLFVYLNSTRSAKGSQLTYNRDLEKLVNC
jgi:hypothetical protein